MRRLVCVLVLVLSTVEAGLLAEQNTDQVLSQFVPAEFGNFASRVTNVHPVMAQSGVAVDLNGGVAPTHIIGAYGNAFFGVVRLIRLSPLAAVAEYEIPICDSGPRLNVVHVLPGAGSQVLVTCLNGNGSNRHQWILQPASASLASLNPVRSEPGLRSMDEPFVNATVSDLDGDGLDEVYVPDPHFGEVSASGNVIQSFTAYAIGEGGRFGKTDNPVVLLEKFVRTEGEPNEFSCTFSAAAGNYSLIVRNGDDPKGRVDSGEIAVNGAVLAGPREFKANQPVIRKDIELMQSNTLKVVLRSKPGSALYVQIKAR